MHVRRMLAQVLILEADPFVAMWKDLTLPNCRDRCIAQSRPGSGVSGPSRQGARPVRYGRRGENALYLIDSAEVGAADEESRSQIGKVDAL